MNMTYVKTLAIKSLAVKVLITLCLLVSVAGQAKQTDGISILSHTLDSQVANETLTVKVALPYGFDKPRAYPVLYTTAGGSRFDALVHQVDWLSHVAMGPMPQFIVVNIPQVSVKTDMHPKFIAASGITNKRQLNLLVKELQPFIDNKYVTQGFNVLEGFSSNANFLLYAYLEQAPNIHGYLVHSPALELDQSKLVERLTALSITEVAARAPLYLSVGPFVNNMPLYQKIKGNMQVSENAAFADLSQHNFLSVATLSLNNSVEWLFSDLTPEVMQFAEGGVSAVKAYYGALAKKYNKPMDDSNTILNLSFYYADNGKPQQAISTIDTLITASPDNIYFLTRKAAIYQKLANMLQAKEVFLKAKLLAKQANNQDALSFINGELAKL